STLRLMAGVLIGFAIIVAVIAVGYLVARIGLLGEGAAPMLQRLAFFVLLPALLFTVLAGSDVHRLFSRLLPVSAIAAVVVIAVYLVVALGVWRRPVPDATLGALGAGYVNSNNIGLPVSLYVLGDASSSAPVILLQLVVLAPIALTVLDLTTSSTRSVRRILLQPVRNPLIIASALGLLVAVTGLPVPQAILDPFELIGGAGIPVVLIAFGISLHGARPLAPGPERRDVVLAALLKLLAMPLVAWAVGRFLFGMQGHDLFVVVVLAALPAAQNVFTYAQRYGRGEVLARDIVLVTTAASVVVLAATAALLGPN
ncbi:MAG TPA: AEC family transporter, partial [Pseudolysinimonas sp.]|nr:AEC family transporter [Pseudolysinimonas sp.]